MTLVLVCVFEIAKGSAGTVRELKLTPTQAAHVAALEYGADDDCGSETCFDRVERERRRVERALCQDAFKQRPDLAWAKAVRL